MRKFTFSALCLLLLSGLFIGKVDAQVIFNADFNAGGMPANFTLYNVDNRTPASAVAYVTDAWIVRDDFVTTADSCAFSTSWYTPAGSADDWMVTPAITLPATAATLSWEGLAPDPQYPDGYEVYVTTSNTLAALQAATPVFSVSAENNAWTPRSVSLASFTGQTVYVSFRNNSTDQFVLMIDDIQVEVQAAFDAKMDSIVGLGEYTQIPLFQLSSPFNLSGSFSNNGATAVTQATLTVNVVDLAGPTTVFTGTSTPVATLAAGGNQTVSAGSWTPATVGNYRLDYIVSIAENDGAPSNDTLSQGIIITDSTYARDVNTVDGTIGIGAGTPGVIGQAYTNSTACEINSVSFFIANTNGTMDGQPIYVEIYDMNSGSPNSVIATTDTFTVPAAATNLLITTEVSGGPLTWSPTTELTFGVVEGDSNITLGYSNSVFTPGVTWIDFPNNPFSGWANSEAYNLPVAYIIRPNVRQACPTYALTFSVNDANCGATDGSATVNISGGGGPFTYAWSNAQTTQTATNLGAGSYTVTITDANGCSEVGNATVGNIGGPQGTATATDVTCNGDSDGTATITPSGGSTPYTYAWSSGGSTQTITGLAAGTYTVTVTDAQGCILNGGSVTVGEPTAIANANTVTDESVMGANDGAITAAGSGGTGALTYAWTGPNGYTGSGASISGLEPGAYVLTITDANGCTFTDNITVQAGPVGINDPVDGALVEIYPNPNNGIFTLNVETVNTEDIRIEIYDMVGQIIYSDNVDGTRQYQKEVNLNDMAAGSYLLKISHGEKTKMRKLVIK